MVLMIEPIDNCINHLKKNNDYSEVIFMTPDAEKLTQKVSNRLSISGYTKHEKVLNMLKKISISVVCSRWEEPFGRTSLEAASRGCAVIISNRGGLPETITNGIILRNLNSNTLFDSIESLIKDKNKLKDLQNKSIKNFFLTDDYITNKIDHYRNEIIYKFDVNLWPIKTFTNNFFPRI